MIKGLQVLIGVSRALGLAMLLGVCPLARAALECSVGVPAPPTEPDNPRHHPVGRELPRSAAYNQPDACGDGFWYFDEDRDGSASAGEPRLYGPQRTIICASCHGDEPVEGYAAASSVFLRQDASRLCLVCHNI